MPEQTKLTITQIASRIGVSKSTVSRVINKDKDVSPKTRSRVEAALKEIGYTPDPFARSLKTGRSQILQLVVAEVDSFFIPTIMQGIEKAAYENGYRLLLSSLDYERRTVAPDGMVAGIIYAIDPVASIDIQAVIPNQSMPVVCVYGYEENGFCPSILPDDEGGAYEAVRHLASVGRKNIVHIPGLDSYIATGSRREGYLRAMKDSGLEDNILIAGSNVYSEFNGYMTMIDLIRRQIPFDAVFAGNDQIAAGVYRGLAELGLSIPGDVALVGFDDKEYAEIMNPPLTTMALPLQDMGRRACLKLIDCIRSGSPNGPGLYKPEYLSCLMAKRLSA